MTTGILPSLRSLRRRRKSPQTALPEELILFQRVLTLFRGLCTKHSVELTFISELVRARLCMCMLCVHKCSCPLLTAHGDSFRACQTPFAEHLLRQKDAMPSALSAAGEPEAAESAEQQRIPGTDWAMRFDDDGEPEYVHTVTGQVVFTAPPEVEAIAANGADAW